MYDFPASPTEGQEFHPVGGPVYIFSSPRWLIKAGGSEGGSGGSGASWDEITGKPTTFPPTLPIAQSGVTNLPTDLSAKAPLASPGLTGTPTAPTAAPGTNTTQIASTAFVGAATAWSAIPGKPATFPPTLPIAESDVTNLVTDLAAKAPLASPTFTGDPKAPTPANADNDTSIATTAFVKAQAYAPLASPAFTGDPTAPTQTLSDNDTSIATTAFVQGVVSTAVAPKAPLDNPVFTGNPQAPTPTAADNDQSIATTGFVQGEIATLKGTASASFDTLGEIENSVTSLLPVIAAKADIASPTFTGDPKAPTPSAADNDTSIATTAFVQTVAATKLSDAPSDGTTYGRKDGAWVEAGGGGAATAVSDTAPVSPTQGQLWFDSSTANLYLWYDDGTSGQWVQVNATGAA